MAILQGCENAGNLAKAEKLELCMKHRKDVWKYMYYVLIIEEILFATTELLS